LEIGMILLFHGSLFSVICSLLGVGGTILSIGFAMLFFESRSEYSKIQREAVNPVRKGEALTSPSIRS